MAAGENSNSTSAVMDVLEGFAAKWGKEDILQDKRWQGLRKKTPAQVIPYVIACVKDEGLGGILSAFGLGSK